MTQPLVSVLMTAYNREKYIGEAIDSVIASTYTNWELIIVDDGSKDNTVAIAQAYAAKDSRIKVYINEKNLGDYPNRNKAASYANGKYIKYVDSDDAIYPAALQQMVQYMEKAPNIGLGLGVRAHCSNDNIGKVWTPTQAYQKHFFNDGFLENGPLGAIILTAAFYKVGGFSGKRMIGDLELWLKITLLYSVVELPKNLVFYRVHDNQESTVGFEYYLIDQFQLYTDVFKSKQCPLSQQEKLLVLKKRKQLSRRSIVSFFIKTFNLKKALQYNKQIQIINKSIG